MAEVNNFLQNEEEKCFAWIDEHIDEFQKFWKDIVLIESPSSYKKGVDEVARKVNDFASEYGLSGEIISFETAGNSVWIHENTETKKKKIVLMAHMDTVHAVGSFPNPIVWENDGYLHGPGAYDCKGGVTVALLVAAALKNVGKSDYIINLFFTGDEEVGHRNSDHGKAIEDAVRDAYAVYNCECASMDGMVCVGRKGAHNFKLVIEGVSAHSGNDPEKGRSVILEAAHKVIELEALTDIWGEGTIVNCGLISGGTVSNAIPGNCQIDVNVRYKTMDAITRTMEKVYEIASKHSVPDTKTTVIEENSPHAPMTPNEKNYWLYNEYKKAAEPLGFEKNEPLFAGGGSDAVIPYRLGIPVLCQTGVRGDSHHTLRERAWIASLSERSKMLVKSIMELPDNYIGR